MMKMPRYMDTHPLKLFQICKSAGLNKDPSSEESSLQWDLCHANKALNNA